MQNMYLFIKNVLVYAKTFLGRGGGINNKQPNKQMNT